MRNFLFILFFLISFNLLSREAAEEAEVFPKKITNLNKVNWKASLITKKGIEHLKIVDQKTKRVILSQPSDYAIHGAVAVDAFSFKGSSKNYIIAVWSKGAHGQNVKIIEPGAKKTMLYSYNSSWPLSYKIEDNRIVINATGDMNPDNLPDEEVIIWGPKGLISQKTIKPTLTN